MASWQEDCVENYQQGIGMWKENWVDSSEHPWEFRRKESFFMKENLCPFRKYFLSASSKFFDIAFISLLLQTYFGIYRNIMHINT
mgnify:CR=1 FL=1